MTMNERRFIPATVRSEQASGKKILSGYAAKFDTLSSDLGGWREKLAPGCFRDSLASGRDIKCLADHDSSKLLGSVSNRTLSLKEDSRGLWFRVELPPTTAADDLYQLVKRQDLTECSFGFTCDDQAWTDESDPEDKGRKIPVRTVKRANLFEVSCVCWGAYPSTSVAVDAAARSLFPAGLVPLEIRSRMSQAKISAAEYAERLAARTRAELLMLGL